MSKKTLFLIFALFLITVVLLMMAFYQPQASKTAQTTPTVPEKIAAQTTLLLGTPILATSSSVLNLYSLPVEITTGENKTTAVQLELQYDPEVLTDVNVIPGPFFGNADVLLNQIDTKTGRISYAISVNLAAQGISGKGTVAYITFSSKINTQKETAILFLPKTLATATGINESVLRQTTNGLFMIGKESFPPRAQ